MIRFAIGFGLLLLSGSAFSGEVPGLHTECFREAAPVAWGYCVHSMPGSTNPDVVYHFHGRNGSEHDWNESTYFSGMIHEAWSAMGAQAPRVVSVSFGPVWLLVEKNAKKQSGLLEIMTRTVLPTIESRIGGIRGRRLLVGESMGGLNSIALALKAGDSFSKIAILCPPISPVSPFAGEREIRAAMKKIGARDENAIAMIVIGRRFLSDEAAWKRFSPLELVQGLDPAHTPKLYLSCGIMDQYGAYWGSERFGRLARERGADLDWRPLYGRHCNIDVRSVAEFLVR